MQDSVDEWLDRQAEVGTTVSEGVFTIDPAKAWTKLGASALPATYSWVLKLVQSAVRAKTGLDIRQSRNESVFTWGTSQAWNHDLLAGAVFSIDGQQEDQALNHLAVAVRALATSRCGFRFWIQYSDGVRAEWTGSGFELSSRRVPDSFPLSLGVWHKTSGEAGTSIQLAAVSAEISTILCRHCQWSPRRITLDHREISNIFEDLTFRHSQGHQVLCLLASPASQSRPNLRVRANFSGSYLESKFNVRPDSGYLARATRSTISSIGLVTHSSSKKSASQFAWVLDGVELFREDLPLPRDAIALLAACSAEALETDISGMRLRDTPEKQQRMLTVLEGLGHTFEDGGTTMSEYPKETSSRPMAAFGFGAGLGLLTCLTSPVGGVFIMAGSFFGAIAAFTHNGTDGRPEHLPQIREVVQHFLGELTVYATTQKKR